MTTTFIDTEPRTLPDRTDASGHRVVVKAARRQYGTLAALDDLHLEIEPGRFTVLLGPSGSGKSTLVRSIAGVERLDSGSIRLGNQVAQEGNRMLPPERRDLAMVFQDYALWPHLSARQNVGYALKRRRLPATVAASRIAEALDRVGLDAKGHRYPHELSGGEQQRVALARAVVARPALLLFDEPLSNLDADLRERLRVEIATLTRECGATALYITHDQAEAFALADEVGVLRGGRLEQFAAPEEIYRNPATLFVAKFTGVAGTFDARVLHIRDGWLTATLGEHVVRARSAETLGVLEDVALLLRPTAARLGAATECDVSGATGLPWIPAVVRDIAYRGRGYEHVVDTAYGPISSVFDARPWSRGSRCAVQLDPEGCIAFPRTDQS